MLKAASEGLENFRSRLDGLLKNGLRTIETGIKAKVESVNERANLFCRLSFLNPFLIGAGIVAGMAVGSWGLSWYLSTTVRDQLQRIENNKFELRHQAEALKKGHFFRHPEDGKLYVEVLPETEYESNTGRHWAALLIE